MTIIAVIDGDVISYKASAANESRTIVATHTQSGRQKEFRNRTEFREFLTANSKFTEDQFTIEDVQTPDELSYGLHTVKKMVENICDKVETKHYQLILSGKENFRLDLPLPKRYKSGRDDSLRPKQLSDVRDYLLNFHGAVIAPAGLEADDDLASRAYKGWTDAKKGKDIKVVQCTPDKDALGTMGWLLNWDKMDSPKLIEGLGELHWEGKKLKGSGRKWFYHQSVFGDPVDTYRPADLKEKAKFGETASMKLLGDAKTDAECLEAVRDQYKKWYPDPVSYIAWDGREYTKDWLNIWQMYVDCAHMRRWPDDQIVMRDLLGRMGLI